MKYSILRAVDQELNQQQPRKKNPAEGNTEETERLVRTWLREATRDLAELANNRHYACRALGMAAATSPAVECIRAGLANPSYVMPFIEPRLPYYDSKRDQPAFVGLLAELQRQ